MDSSINISHGLHTICIGFTRGFKETICIAFTRGGAMTFQLTKCPAHWHWQSREQPWDSSWVALFAEEGKQTTHGWQHMDEFQPLTLFGNVVQKLMWYDNPLVGVGWINLWLGRRSRIILYQSLAKIVIFGSWGQNLVQRHCVTTITQDHCCSVTAIESRWHS